MKKIEKIVCGLCIIFLSSCVDLDLNPLAMGTNENWYSDEQEITIALNDLYKPAFWSRIGEDWTDNEAYRNTNTSFVAGTITGQDATVTGKWANLYKAIARANSILATVDKIPAGKLTEVKKNTLKGEAFFIRAAMYSDLVFYFGDVPYTCEQIDIDEAFSMGRTAKEEVVKAIYADFDQAIDLLPVETGAVQRATKGAALALKARFALYQNDWATVVEATNDCINLDKYKLYPDYGELFLSTTHNTEESIFSLPRSVTDGVTLWADPYITRNNGGWAASSPSWDLLASYTCTDGLPIDESPLFDPRDPFKNRDPRCNETIVPFGTEFLGFEYNPHPDALEVMNYSTGKMQLNNDTKANTQHASYNGLVWKKGVDDTWLLNGHRVEVDNIIIRYADVLLMYAEAKIELGQIDDTVIKALNLVRARAYGVPLEDVKNYPEIESMDQDKLRSIVRMERRMEFARENSRYYDLIRWKIAEKALCVKSYGLLYPAELLREKVTTKGLWFWGATPDIDENGIVDFSKLEEMGVIMPLIQRSFSTHQYLWPIPTKEILINENIKQNPGY